MLSKKLLKLTQPVFKNIRYCSKLCIPYNENNQNYTTNLDFVKDWNNIETYRYYDLKGKVVADRANNLDYKELNNVLYHMVRLEIIDDILLKAQRQGRISFMMGSIGETATTIGVAAGVKFTDIMMTQYREQGCFYYRGYTIAQALNQCTGNKLCPALGRQMPHHYGDIALNMHFVSSPLATQISHAAGAGYGYSLRNEDKICVCWFGEGAASEGDFFAGINFGATLGSQTLYLARNNQYAISTHFTDQFKSDGIAVRGLGVGMKTLRVDGNDAVAVMQATQFARDYIVKNKAPVLLEAMTYRVSDHSTSDHSILYRNQEEIDSWKNNNNQITR